MAIPNGYFWWWGELGRALFPPTQHIFRILENTSQTTILVFVPPPAGSLARGPEAQSNLNARQSTFHHIFTAFASHLSPRTVFAPLCAPFSRVVSDVEFEETSGVADIHRTSSCLTFFCLLRCLSICILMVLSPHCSASFSIFSPLIW